MKLNQIIREKRKELSLTQEQIAERLGVSTPAVNKWEKGSREKTHSLLTKSEVLKYKKAIEKATGRKDLIWEWK